MNERYIFGLLVLISIIKIDNAISFRLAHLQPSGPMYLTEGDPIEIPCTLDDTENYTIDDLELLYNRKSLNSEVITISNDTKVFRIKKAPIMEMNLDCTVNRMGADRTIINVGTKPERVINFKCRSYNWENLTCSFERPYNPVPVNYTLYYATGFGDEVFKMPVNVCNLKPNYNRIFTCSIGFQSESPYRQSYDFYFFRLIEKNDFGSLTENFTIDHFSIVIPSPPENVNATNITSNSVILNWKISAAFEHFPKQFVYMINYTSEFHKEKWIQLGPFVESNKHEREQNNRISHALTNLPYANTWYDCRVALKVRDAENTAEMWSNYSTHVFKTESRIPDRPPRTDIGSFSFTDSGHVFIYWKELQKSENNGPNFKYVIFGANNTNLISTRTLTKLEQIDANVMRESYDFHIYSQNDVGKSRNHSIVRVPAIQERCEPPTLIKKIRLDNETYNISWVAPVNDESAITSYTVFWCEPNNESPTDCKGSIDFESVTNTVLSYRLKTKNSMNFAIAANTATSSSGMVWAMCTVLPGNEINKLTSIITVRVQSTSIEFKWSLACVDRTILTGYVLEYCPIKDPKTEECKEPPKTHNITAMAKEYKLENLKPYTTYSVRIRMLSENSIGPWSESQVNTTLEAAPTPPRNLRYHNITNTSVALTWDVPEVINGVLVRYEVSFNGKIFTAEKTEGTQQYPYVLKGLHSFTEYEVVVRACTVLCSASSNPIIFNTTIGYPGGIPQPKVINQNSILKWVQPATAGGPLDFYEIQVTHTNNDGGSTERIIQINGTQCHFTKEFRDILNDGQFDYSVRAVNVLHSSHYKELSMQEQQQKQRKRKRDLMSETYIDAGAANTMRESALLKRHSKPEIDTESKMLNANQHHHSQQKLVITDSTNVSPMPAPLPPPPPPPSHKHYQPHHSASSSADLTHIKICIEEDDQQLHDFLKADKWPTLYKGPYSLSYSHTISSHASSRGYLYLIVLLIVFTMASVYATYFGFKKLKRMKDISVELPEGLEDIKEESKSAKHLDGGGSGGMGGNGGGGIGGGGVVMHDDDMMDHLHHHHHLHHHGTLDYRTNNEQENDPLVRFRMESASSTASSESNSQSEYNEGIDNSIEYEQNTEEDSVRSGSDNIVTQLNKSSPTPFIPMHPSDVNESEMNENSTSPSPLLPMSSEIRRSPPPAPTPQQHHLHSSQANSQFNARPLAQQSGALPPLTSNGYVTHDAIIGKPVVSSGYTPWSAIDARKRAEQQQQQQQSRIDDTKTKTSIITSTDLQGISGYVTHKQLSDFGQLMH